MAKGVDGIAVGAILVGGLLVYSGVTGRGVLKTTQAVIQGTAPSTVAQDNPITVTNPPVTGTAAGGGVVDGSIASIAESYIGADYVFGGAPAKGVGNWDCSSFVNWVVGVKAGRAIPRYAAGKYTGSTHGPVTTEWLVWTGAVFVSHNPADAQPGDLCCWQTHMGIAIGGGEMVSARTEKDNPPTGKGAIHLAGELLYVRRLKA